MGAVDINRPLRVILARASDCSHQLLRLIAATAKNGVHLETAKHAWARSIRRRINESVRNELRMRCSRSPFITTEDVRLLNLTPDGDQQDHHSSEKVCSENLIGDQLKVGPGFLGTKRHASPSRVIHVDDTVRRKRRKQSRRDFGDGSGTRAPVDGDNDSRVSDHVRWDRRTNGDQITSYASPKRRKSSTQVASLSEDTRLVAHAVAHNFPRNYVDSSRTLICNGPYVAVKLRRVIESLALQDENYTSFRLAGRCCTGCRSKIDVLDEMLDGVMRVASLVGNLTDHKSDGLDPRIHEIPI